MELISPLFQKINVYDKTILFNYVIVCYIKGIKVYNFTNLYFLWSFNFPISAQALFVSCSPLGAYLIMSYEWKRHTLNQILMIFLLYIFFPNFSQLSHLIADQQ